MPQKNIKSQKNGKAKQKETQMGRQIKSGTAALGGTLGTALAGPIGGMAGWLAGGVAGSLISSWAGQGDYKVSQNSLLSPRNQQPYFNANSQTVTVRHREFIGSISGSVGFAVPLSLPLNPGIDVTFPWLSPIAAKFQQYRIKGMIFQYVPTSGTFTGTSSALGTVMMQTTYRATDADPLSKVEMLNEYWSNETVASQGMFHAIECNPRENPFSVHYVRTSAILSGEPLMYDMGKTYIATQGMDNTGVVGDIWCTYEIELKKPLIASAVVNPASFYTRRFTGFTTTSFFIGSSITDEFGSNDYVFGARSITFPKLPYVKVYSVMLALHDGLFSGTSPLTFDGVPSTSGGVTLIAIGGITSFGTTITATAAPTSNTLTLEYNVSVPANAILPTVVFPAPNYTGAINGTAATLIILER